MYLFLNMWLWVMEFNGMFVVGVIIEWFVIKGMFVVGIVWINVVGLVTI